MFGPKKIVFQNMLKVLSYKKDFSQKHFCLEIYVGHGQATVEIIIPNPVLFNSSPLLPLSFQRKIYMQYNNLLFFSEYSGAG